jgi:hypothetical protein
MLNQNACHIEEQNQNAGSIHQIEMQDRIAGSMDQLNCRTDQNKNHTRTHEHLN